MPAGLYAWFEDLLVLPEAEREERLAALPAAEAELLRGMLRVDLQPPAELPPFPLAELLDLRNGYGPGQRLGSFELGQCLGSGGMGQVFAATRIGDTAQRVAIKVQLPVLANEETLRRFRLERQVLAGLEHPVIARLIECGEDTEGRPYFAMEWVDGCSIKEHCDAHRLSLADRARLFLRLCEGVDYAHRHLVVHRDIKTSNVMVNREGLPKLLDFGIAKPLDAQTGQAEGTATHARVFSPCSAAPEQVRGAAISVACDVYSLGALLYELISGSPPYRLNGLTPAEIEARICDQPPLAPSEQIQRLHRTAPDAAVELARLRGIARSGALVSALRHDLDRIVLHALRKRPHERYPSVAALQADIQRWLQGEAVWARGMGRLYRLRKFLWRHRLASVLVGAWVVAMSIVTPMLWLQASALRAERDEVRRQLQRADEERRHAEQVTAFIEQTFAMADPGRALGDALSITEILDTALRSLQHHRIEQPRLQHRLQMSLVRVMLSLGRPDDAAAALESAPVGLDRLAMIQRTRALAELALARSDTPEALRHSAAAIQGLAAGPPIDADTVARTWLTRAHALRATQPAAALQAIEHTLTALEQVTPPPAEVRSSAISLRARLLLAAGRPAEALQELQGLLVWQRAHLPHQHPAVLETLRLLAVQHKNSGDHEQALRHVEEQVQLALQVFGERSVRVAQALNARGNVHMDRGMADAAAADYSRSLDLLVARLGAQHSHVAQVHYNLGEVERLLRLRPLQAETHYREAIKIAQDGPQQRVPMVFRLGLGAALSDLRRGAEARAEIEAVIASEGPHAQALQALALGELALLEMREGRIAEASRAWIESRALLHTQFEPNNPARRRLELNLAALGSYPLGPPEPW